LHLPGDQGNHSFREIFMADLLSPICQSKITFFSCIVEVVELFIISFGYGKVMGKAKDVKENLGIMWEFSESNKLANFCFLLTISWITLQAVGQGLASQFCRWPYFACTIMWYLNINYKSLAKATEHAADVHESSRDKDKNSAGSSKPRAPSSPSAFQDPKAILEQFLSNDELFSVFEKFLCLEFSVENAYFIRDVDAYQKRRSGRTALKIYDQYISNDAKMMINISAAVKQQIVGTVAGVQKDSQNSQVMKNLDQGLTAARAQIFDLILKDTFRRFKHTDECIAAMDKLNEQA